MADSEQRHEGPRTSSIWTLRDPSICLPAGALDRASGRHAGSTVVKVGVAREAAYRWVTRHGRRETGFAGAYYTGSTVALAGDTELPPTCDVDVVVVVRGSTAPVSLGTFLY